MITLTKSPPIFSLEDFQANPPENKEWVNGQLIEKNVMTLHHSKLQATLAFLWKKYLLESGQGGEVYVELPCITTGRGRRPDVCYLGSELVAQYGNEATLPQSPNLVAEIVSPNDVAEDLFSKAAEYLESGCGEVWLVFPESHRLLILTMNQTLAFQGADTASTQQVLLGFRVTLPELFA
ncbi:MAG: Uma2 family endonuclease [Microcystaceae cyanobacterium]